MPRKSIIEYGHSRQVMLGAVKKGMNISQTAQLAGVSRNALHEVLKRGREQKTGKYRQFYDEWQQAEAAGVLELLEKIASAADKHWQAAAWLLERMYPERFARPETRIAINAKDGNDDDTDGKQSPVVVYIPDNGR